MKKDLVRVEIHLKKDETKKIDSIAKKKGRSRKNFCETEIKNIISNLSPNGKIITKDQILEAWRKYYKGRHGIPMNTENIDAEILEQLAIEQYRGDLMNWVRLAVTPKEV